MMTMTIGRKLDVNAMSIPNFFNRWFRGLESKGGVLVGIERVYFPGAPHNDSRLITSGKQVNKEDFTSSKKVKIRVKS